MTDSVPKDKFADLFEATGAAFSSYLEAGELTDTIEVATSELSGALDATGFSLVGGGDTAGPVTLESR
ncbi:hypothetical protein [Halobellus marinus]|uniref:hypothetical protein n=1 Tax=Halobellus TaxID=1073986 RepID=UPI0028AD3BC8|nr:hypothetical protein [Halobellus sp. DFY28]